MSESTAPRKSWQVSISLPIEADGRDDAVRQFWDYVAQLGPDEIPAYVSPYGDELDMLAYVAGVETDLDPEED